MRPVKSRTLKSPKNFAFLLSSSIALVSIQGLDVGIERMVTNQFRLLVLAEDAIKSAIKDYKKKRAAAALPAEDVAAASPAVAAA